MKALSLAFLGQLKVAYRGKPVAAIESKKVRAILAYLAIESERSHSRESLASPWGGPNYNPQGWKGPCYLITDGHYRTFDELMTQTDWEKYEHKRDPRCANCMIHNGFEHTVVREVGKSWKDLWEMLRWNLA